MISSRTVTLCFSLLLPTVAVAQQDRRVATFDAIDTNNDGSIDRDEFSKGIKKFDVESTFAELDGDKDGKITKEEATRAYEQRDVNREAARILRQVDANNDGVVDRAEFVKTDTGRRSPNAFLALDSNRNGTIDESEIRIALKKNRGSLSSNRVPRPGLATEFDQVAPAASSPPAGMPSALLLDQAYDALPGVDPRLLSLDLYSAEGDGPHPIMVMVHGGGWSKGDKTGRAVLAPKARWLSRKGWLFASVNYRLSPAVNHPEHANDVAQSIAWLIEHADEFNGDPDRIFLMGHSSGAHIVAAVACDPRHLERAGLSPDVIKGTIPLDVGAYDISMRTELSERGRTTFDQAFGTPGETDFDPWVEASPITYTREQDAGERIAPFLVVSSSNPGRRFALENARSFSKALQDAGVPVEIVAPDKTHSECNRDVGVPGDTLTIAVEEFLQRRLSELSLAQQARKSNVDSP